jgi:hypothetical protein
MSEGGRVLSDALYEKEKSSKTRATFVWVFGPLLWYFILRKLGPDFGKLFLIISLVAGMFICVRYAPKSTGISGWSVANKRGVKAAGELDADEIDASLRGRPAPQGSGQFNPYSAYKVDPTGNKLSSVVSDARVGEGNKLLSNLAAEREARRGVQKLN